MKTKTRRTARRAAWCASFALMLALLLAPARANAFGGVPLQSMSVQLHERHLELFLDRWDPGLLTPSGLATWFARALIAAPDLNEIHWTAETDERAEQVAARWGLRMSQLAELNPGLERDTPVEAGTQLLVYRANPEEPTRSIGKCHRGRLQHGMPMPEGPYWMLRHRRSRHYGARATIKSLAAAFMLYGRAFPDGPRVRVGELSKRRGRRIRPHKSHRSGRDADIIYIGKNITEADGPRPRVTYRNVDVEKQWFLVKALLDTGHVQTIGMDRRMQRKLSRYAERELSEEELARIFEYPRREGSRRAIIQHWSGHHRHMHVRFKCEPGNRRCRD